MLRTEHVQVARAGRIAVADASIEVAPHEAVAIVGPNGAGKSTLLRAISGLERVGAGRVTFDGQELSGRSPRAILRQGVVQVPEGRQLFPELSVQQNLWLGGFMQPKARRQANVDRLFALFPRLAERRRQLAGSLSGGEQQVLAIARAMASEPRLLMLDEPSIGLSPKMIETVREVVEGVRASGISILLVEQNIALAKDIASRVYVLVTGRVVARGPAAAMLTAERLARAFLGEEVGEDAEEGDVP